MKRRETGNLGEKLARDFLKKRKYRILETNYRCRRGEIDIIARHKDSLVFIEVRTKISLEFGSPEESITSTKMAHLRAAARYYLKAHSANSFGSAQDKSGQAPHGLPEEWRIDVVAVELTEDGKPSRIELIENAVGEG